MINVAPKVLAYIEYKANIIGVAMRPAIIGVAGRTRRAYRPTKIFLRIFFIFAALSLLAKHELQHQGQDSTRDTRELAKCGYLFASLRLLL